MYDKFFSSRMEFFQKNYTDWNRGPCRRCRAFSDSLGHFSRYSHGKNFKFYENSLLF